MNSFIKKIHLRESARSLQKGETMKEIKKSYDRAEVEVIRFIACDVITTSGDGEQSSQGGVYDGSWDTNYD